MWLGAECLPSIPETLEALGNIPGWRGEGWLGKRWEVLIVASFVIVYVENHPEEWEYSPKQEEMMLIV